MKHIALLFLLLPVYCCHAQTHQLNLATYNLRYDNADDIAQGNGWKQRQPEIVRIIRFYGFDLFGTQEGLIHQLRQLKDSLPGFDFTGVGRDDGKEKGEHAAIFYNTSRFRLLDKGTFWLSPNTEKPEKGWDAALPRICSWGRFKELKTGFTFYFFNLHMDHIGVISRRESARLVLELIRKKAGALPVILTGDFNADQHEAPYAMIQSSGLLQDAYTATDVRWAPSGTFNAFDTRRCSDNRIDHIFLTKTFRVTRYGILNNTYTICPGAPDSSHTAVQKFPSDHFPVMAVLQY